jgi:Rad3-related DNA helicase
VDSKKVKIMRKDGVHLSFRPQQNQFIDWVEKNLAANRVLGGQLRTGVGKTAIIRAIQASFPSSTVDVLSYSNQLVDEYSNLYGVNAVKGRNNYDTVEEWQKHRKLAEKGTDSIFNPYSWIFFADQCGGRYPDLIIFDEAHKILEMVHSFATTSIRIESLAEKHGVNGKKPNDFQVQEILKKAHRSYSQTCIEERFQAMRVEKLRLDLLEHPEFYTVTTRSLKRKHYLDVSPLHTPIHLVKQLFPAKKYIAISATMPPAIFNEMFPEGQYFSMPHPVSSDRRQVIPLSVHEDDRRDFDVLAPIIDSLIESEGRPNTVIHCTYADAKTLSKKLKTPTIAYNKSRKTESVQLFKERGGVLIGAGIAEGISFPGDECRLQIIPVLPYASLFDDYVKMRKACTDGESWYKLKTMLTFWQMVGRGCRSETDFCRTYVLDPHFGRLVAETKKQFGPSLTDSIIWNHHTIGALVNEA